jgi:hypothetical protein
MITVATWREGNTSPTTFFLSHESPSSEHSKKLVWPSRIPVKPQHTYIRLITMDPRANAFVYFLIIELIKSKITYLKHSIYFYSVEPSKAS